MGKITRKQAITAINLTIDQLYMKVMTGEGTKRYWSEDEKTLSSFHEDMLRLERCLSDKEFQKELRIVPVQELQEYYLLIIELSRAYDLPSKAFLESHTLIENRKKTIMRMFLNILLDKEVSGRLKLLFLDICLIAICIKYRYVVKQGEITSVTRYLEVICMILMLTIGIFIYE